MDKDKKKPKLPPVKREDFDKVCTEKAGKLEKKWKDGLSVHQNRTTGFKFFAKVDDLSEGLGLGLPLTKRHAQNLGGDLTLDDNYHDGCRFIIELPLN